MALVIEPGHCDPNQCNSISSTFINPGSSPDSTTYKVCNRLFQNATVVKQLLKGTMAVPWVRLRFEGDNCPPPPFNVNGSGPCTDNVSNPGNRADPSYWDYTEITTGNISQPGNADRCRAVIKSFQYAWDGTQAGNLCKIVIHDESGSSFDAWFKRMIRNSFLQNNQATAVNKMKIIFGWLVVGGDTDCPAEVTDVCPPPENVGGVSTCCGNGKLICSQALWFLPGNLTCSLQASGKFIYELEGWDTLRRSQTVPMQSVFGDETATGKTHFLDAAVMLGRKSMPPFNVQFAQLSEDGMSNTIEPLQFWKNPNQGTGNLVIPNVGVQHKHYVDPWTGGTVDGLPWYVPVTGGAGSCTGPLDPGGQCPAGPATIPDLQTRGPLLRYACNNSDPVAALQHWITEVRANTDNYQRDGKGLTFNFDPTFVAPQDASNAAQGNMPSRGRLMVWGDTSAGAMRTNLPFDARKMALYTVNAGRCSPVYSFTPNIKWHWMALQVGGGISPSSGQAFNVREAGNILGTAAAAAATLIGQQSAANIAAAVLTSAPTNSGLDAGGGQRNNIRSIAENWATNALHHTIEAELKVQGDPSDWLCSPAFGNGRNIAIVVVNPFFLSGQDANGCPMWQQASVCHDILTNSNWWISGVEHVIKEGSYVTNIKVRSLFPGIEIPANDPTCSGSGSALAAGCAMGINGDYLAITALCQQGTTPCSADIPEGGSDVNPGIGSAPYCATPPCGVSVCANYDDNANPCANDYVVG